jgi:hypothetical protein
MLMAESEMRDAVGRQLRTNENRQLEQGSRGEGYRGNNWIADLPTRVQAKAGRRGERWDCYMADPAMVTRWTCGGRRPLAGREDHQLGAQPTSYATLQRSMWAGAVWLITGAKTVRGVPPLRRQGLGRFLERRREGASANGRAAFPACWTPSITPSMHAACSAPLASSHGKQWQEQVSVFRDADDQLGTARCLSSSFMQTWAFKIKQQPGQHCGSCHQQRRGSRTLPWRLTPSARIIAGAACPASPLGRSCLSFASPSLLSSTRASSCR